MAINANHKERPSARKCMAATTGALLLNVLVAWMLVVTPPKKCAPTTSLIGHLEIGNGWKGNIAERVGGEVIRCANGSLGLENGSCLPYEARSVYKGLNVIAEREICITKFRKENLTVSLSALEGNFSGFNRQFYGQRREYWMVKMNHYVAFPMCLLIAIISLFKLMRFCKGK